MKHDKLVRDGIPGKIEAAGGTAVKLRARRLTPRNAVKVWAAFYEAHGAEVCVRAYGWDAPPAVPSSERVWAFYGLDGLDDSEPPMIGWGSMNLATRNPNDDEAMVSTGVFPQYQRRGYQRAIHAWLARKAADLGADTMSRTVRKDNVEAWERAIGQALDPGSPWIHAGDTWYPAPGYSYFVWPLDGKKPDPKPQAPPLDASPKD